MSKKTKPTTEEDDEEEEVEDDAPEDEEDEQENEEDDPKVKTKVIPNSEPKAATAVAETEDLDEEEE